MSRHSPITTLYMKNPFFFFFFPFFIFISVTVSPPFLAHALGSGSTVAVAYGSSTVCAIVAAQSTQRIICYRPDGATTSLQVQPNISFSAIAAGRTTLCAVRSGGYALLCWNTAEPALSPKRLYYNDTVLLNDLSIGDEQISATATSSTPSVLGWRGGAVDLPNNITGSLNSISSGFGFTCGISAADRGVRCWGSNPIAMRIEQEFANISMISISAGASHVCGLNLTGFLICRGENRTGQLNAPMNSGLEFASGLAMAENYSCAIRRQNGSVVCWGDSASSTMNSIEGISFELIVSGTNFTCGLTSTNLSVICFGPGWNANSGFQLPLSDILPGRCVTQSSCIGNCRIYADSDRFCSGTGVICRPCFNITSPSPSPPPTRSSMVPQPPSRSRGLRRGLLAFAIVGSVGAFMGICSIIYCLWAGVCFGKKKVHNSVQPTITRGGSNGTATSNSNPPSRSTTIRRQGSRMLTMRRQRSGTSSKHPDKAEEFTLAELAAATNNFAMENKIGAGSFGIVYRGKLPDGREVAIKRGDTGQKKKKFQEKESAFDSELAFLSRLHHKHLVRLVGFCEERDERLLVYEYMKNGALFDHLHGKGSNLLNSWKMRIRIALDAARGIEYLHNYAVPSIIHRDIKSSNILLDANWTARVSDFGLSLMGPESDRDFRPTKAAGTVGYIDPEYYGLNVLTAKSDVYGLGVVMLELLTGKRAIFKDGGGPVNLADFAVQEIMAGELMRILDKRVEAPVGNEVEAVELMGYTAMHCVNVEGRERPTISDIVANLERALILCDEPTSHGSISSDSITIVSD